MSKEPNYTGGQRLDVNHFLFAVREYPKELQRLFVRAAIGIGLLDGFRVRVLPQTGTQVGMIDILNGRGFDNQGNFVNAVSGTNAQRAVVSTPSTEFWIEIEVFPIASDPDQQAFWDSTVDQADPFPDGEEIQVARAFTRRTLFWRVKQPIRQNPALLQTDPAYAPVGFSDNDSLTFPVAVIRTNASGQIMAGDPNVDLYGNDLVSVTTALGVEQFVKVPGWGESLNTGASNQPYVFGNRRTDQRIRIFEPTPYPFRYGTPGVETTSGFESGEWMRDMKSMFDFLATAISEIKHGAVAQSGESSLGQYQDGELQSLDSDYRYVDLKLYVNGNTSPPTVDQRNPNDLMHCTLQIMTGHWGGFAAPIKGNGKTDGAGVTRVYFHRTSSIPEYKSFPVSGDEIRILQNKQVNWLAAPTPDSAFRGLNALDKEVVQARTDNNNGKTAPGLRNRLDAMRHPTVTLSPVDTIDSTTGNPANEQPADYFESISDLQNAVSVIASVRKGGTVHFRKGVYTFDSLIPAETVFSLSGVRSLVFEGEGSGNTFLNFGQSDDTQGIHRLFDLNSCFDIEFRGLTFSGKGEIFRMQGCSNIRFVDCVFDGLYWNETASGNSLGLTTATVDWGSVVNLHVNRTTFTVAGAGLVCSGLERCRWIDSEIVTRNTQSEVVTMMNVGVVTRSQFRGLRLIGTATTAAFECVSMKESKFLDSDVFVTLASAARGLFVASSFFTRSQIQRCHFGYNDSIGLTSAPIAVSLYKAASSHVSNNEFFLAAQKAIVIHSWPFGNTSAGFAENCFICHNMIEQASSDTEYVAIDPTAARNCVIQGNRVQGGSYAVLLTGISESVVQGNIAKGASSVLFTLNPSITGSLGSAAFSGCTISGNLAINPIGWGIHLNGGTKSNVSGNQVLGILGFPGEPYSINSASSLRGGHGVTASSHPWPGDGINDNEVHAYNTYFA